MEKNPDEHWTLVWVNLRWRRWTRDGEAPRRASSARLGEFEVMEMDQGWRNTQTSVKRSSGWIWGDGDGRGMEKNPDEHQTLVWVNLRWRRWTRDGEAPRGALDARLGKFEVMEMDEGWRSTQTSIKHSSGWIWGDGDGQGMESTQMRWRRWTGDGEAPRQASNTCLGKFEVMVMDQGWRGTNLGWQRWPRDGWILRWWRWTRDGEAQIWGDWYGPGMERHPDKRSSLVWVNLRWWRWTRGWEAPRWSSNAHLGEFEVMAMD